MRNAKKILSLILTVMLILSSVSLVAFAEDKELRETKAELESEIHVKYMNGFEDGFFLPKRTLTRAETASILYTLLKQKDGGYPYESNRFDDVSDGSWYTVPINTLAAMGIVSGYAEAPHLYKPSNGITRAEFVTLVSNFYEIVEGENVFSDVPEGFWAEKYIVSATKKGWVTGYGDGTFEPAKKITRAEGITIINKVLNRPGDKEMLDSSSYRHFPDLKVEDWYYVAAMEASIVHEYKIEEEIELWTSHNSPTSVLSKGLHFLHDDLYMVKSNGWFACNEEVDGFKFDADCRYTTGEEKLDEKIKEITDKSVYYGQPQEEALFELYLRVRDDYYYRSSTILDKDEVGWENSISYDFFRYKSGNCYGYAGAFYQLARQIGYNPKTVIGAIKNPENPHCWVEIEIDGVTYIFDPLIESNSKIWGVDGESFFKKTYEEVSMEYFK